MRHLFKIAWRNVRKNWRHSLATIVSIAAGFLALGMFEGYIVGLTTIFEDGMSRRGLLGDVIIEKRGAQEYGAEDPWAYAIDAKEQRFLDDYFAAHADTVNARVRFLSVSGMLSNGKTNAIFLGSGYDVHEGAAMRGERWEWITTAGKPLQHAGARSVMVGLMLSESLDCAINGTPSDRWAAEYKPVEVPFSCPKTRLQLSSTTETGQLNALDAEISGVVNASFKELDQRYVSMPLGLAQQLADTDKVSGVTLLLRDRKHVPEFVDDLRAKAQAAGMALDVMPWQQHKQGELFRQSIDLMGMFRNLVVFVVVIVAGMSVLNTMFKAVSERIREIGSLRSIGFLRRHIVIIFGIEAGLLALLSCVVGLVATLGLSWAVNQIGLRYSAGLLSEPIPVVIALIPSVYAISGVFLSSIAIVAALVPARQAARMAIPEALAHI